MTAERHRSRPTAEIAPDRERERRIWYLFYTQPYKEDSVAEQLKERLSDYNLEVYLPVLEPTGKQGKKRPLFPGYFFATFPLAEVGVAAVSYIPGLNGVVGFGGELAEVPEEVIKTIKLRLEQEPTGAPPPFASGSPVKIIDGSFAELEGIFVEPQGPKRAKILLMILGDLRPVSLDLEKLRKVYENKQISK